VEPWRVYFSSTGVRGRDTQLNKSPLSTIWIKGKNNLNLLENENFTMISYNLQISTMKQNRTKSFEDKSKELQREKEEFHRKKEKLQIQCFGKKVLTFCFVSCRL
jgi:hypothetical protein